MTKGCAVPIRTDAEIIPSEPDAVSTAEGIVRLIHQTILTSSSCRV